MKELLIDKRNELEAEIEMHQIAIQKAKGKIELVNELLEEIEEPVEEAEEEVEETEEVEDVEAL